MTQTKITGNGKTWWLGGGVWRELENHESVETWDEFQLAGRWICPEMTIEAESHKAEGLPSRRLIDPRTAPWEEMAERLIWDVAVRESFPIHAYKHPRTGCETQDKTTAIGWLQALAGVAGN